MSRAQRIVGNTSVTAVGLGGADWSLADGRDDDLSLRTIRDAVESGVTFIDTAYAYTTLDELNHNENLIRRALAASAYSDEVLVGTKGGHWRRGPADFPVDGRPQTLRAHLDKSLIALGVERIGLYQLHHPDPNVPIEESVGAIADFQQQGLVKLIGVSNVDRAQFRRAEATATIASVQNRFSPLHAADRSVLDDARRAGVAFLAYSPFGGRGGAARIRSELPVFAQIAERYGWTLHRAVIAWLLSVSANVVPVVGARSSASIRDSVAGAGQALSDAELQAVEGAIASASQNRQD